MTREIEEKASNYMSGRAMALSFKPLSLEDVREAYLCGAEDYAHLSKTVNPWHKASEELPKEDGIYIVMLGRNSYVCALGFNAISKQWSIADYQSDVKYWMEIPEIKED